MNQQTERLLEKGIDVNIIDNNIYLKNPTEANIEKANEILNSTVLTRASYPTSWYPMNGFSYTTSKKFQKASESGFLGTLVGWLGGITSVTRLGAIFVASFFGELWQSRDEEDIIYQSHYEYREIGSGRFDSNGQFYGEYEIRKTERLISEKGYTSSIQTIKESTILDAWF